MKKIYLLLFFSILLLSCEKEDSLFPDQALEENLSYTEIPFNDLPLSITEIFNAKFSHKGQHLPKNFGRFGSININKFVREIKNKENLSTFTFSLSKVTHPNNIGRYFDNLIVKELNDKSYKLTILRYRPNADYSYSNEINNFSGSITFYEPTGNLLGSIALEKGEQVLDRSNQKGYTTTCTYTVVEICSPYCLITYTESCTTGYDFDRNYDSGGESDSDSGSYDSVERSGSTSTSPIPDEEETDEEETVEEEQIVNDLENPCASLTFGQLLLLSSSYQLPEIVDINPDLESLNFSQAILNMFNDDQNYDYAVKERLLHSTESSAFTNPSPIFNSSTGKYTVTTFYNPNYLSTATTLSTARTMIHESIHAYLVYQQRLNPARDVHELVDNYAKQNGFTSDLNLIHHNFMSQFVNSISYNLYLWDKNHGTGGSLGWQYYHDLAWGGLANYRDRHDDTKILFYKEFENYLKSLDDPLTTVDESAAVKQRILKAIENEATNNSSAKGDDCP